jgi:hypothetical protein
MLYLIKKSLLKKKEKEYKYKIYIISKDYII